MSTTRNHSEVGSFSFFLLHDRADLFLSRQVCDLFTAAGVKLSPEDEESVFRTPASNP